MTDADLCVNNSDGDTGGSIGAGHGGDFNGSGGDCGSDDCINFCGGYDIGDDV